MQNQLIKISTMSGKLSGIPAINTNTITNPFCVKMSKSKKTICGQCYSVSMLKTYRKNCQPAFQHNSDILSDSVLLPQFLPFLNYSFLRINGHGELINSVHLENIINICIKNSHCTVALWTKRKDLVAPFIKDNKIPDNLILVYSNPTIDKPLSIPPVGFHKVFNNVTQKKYEASENCTGQKCQECLACYKKNSGIDVIIEKVK